jgi:hypothetical protein
MKEYWEQAERLRRRINRKIHEIHLLRQRAEGMNGSGINDMPRTVSPDRSKMEGTVFKIMALEQDIQETHAEYDALIADIFLDERGYLALQKLLLPKSFCAQLTDKACNEQRQRSKEKHRQRYAPIYHQHENKRAGNGDNTGEKLQKQLGQTVADRVDVVYYAAYQVAVRIRVYI